MLTGYSIAILGGDARQLEVIRRLIELDATLHLIGFDQLDHGFTGAKQEALDDVDPKELDAMILPVPGTNLQGEIDTIFSNQSIQLTKEWLEQTPEHCLLFTGITNNYLTNLTQETNRTLIPLFDRNDVAIYNSIPTVEGTIMMAIQHTDFTIHSSTIFVLGLGRVGMSVARTFASLGAKVKVGARKSEDLARIHEMSLESFSIKDLKQHTHDCDILINTIPAQVVTAAVIQNMPNRTLIIDLASKPGGTDFRYAEKRGIKALLAPGLPGIVAPKTAGSILANVITQVLIEEIGERGNE
ncbi:dipicolinic acid synthetase subunit A [Pontibacillus yanchengensis]|uniref:Dipicolinic acid synthetase subunit A n=2 Tax=Pontibacillus yanchengensis TaxID=462910 RepID=A0ACC7VCU2_9BACI|nr:dipicolinic acid synthetase subunit A [Pontibacillus yanchengensis]MYL33195.1 dipicolinic acid synthetase subunit A [Pontibacillus yanchengensis]MYL51955.1 dipicolinic acid synthetase subunit A [Pontibacillus yanchengensis]